MGANVSLFGPMSGLTHSMNAREVTFKEVNKS